MAGRQSCAGNYIKVFVFALAAFVSTSVCAQKTTMLNAFAHNDYFHKRPLYDALDNGFTNLEADIFLRNGKLVVAHILPMVDNKGTLEDLYLKPLLASVNGSSNLAARPLGPVTLMIDIKSNAEKTYQALNILLNKYSSIISGYENGKIVQRPVTVVITGNKPFKIIKEQKSRLAFIDEDLTKTYKDTLSTNVYQTASCKYSKMLKWNGKGSLPLKQRQHLSAYVKMAHKYGKKVRLWASPENENVWRELLSCGVDLINTDQLPRLRNFLLARADAYAAMTDLNEQSITLDGVDFP
ncbi:hypothetical protein DYU05_00375 [Mucilaginibacter terrenus]|uniref:Altered inheritance of mitochondria protein 6 n=1 Tax=Mucilaginibacter terrenus TaxID=2482727 RepID=A0A3E2NSZ6_9SPHI|nr:phosphatidylinositol-specific phospholipase C/glycerophosphodiester phosphodiesterase family protein [Mucilaginibacter terrenus]RFZ84128.1 hypothetical protein DYU05_00375 [Mucilaginibacter terrenus]